MSNLAYKNWLQGCCLRGAGNDNFPLQKGSKGTRVIKLQVFLNYEGAGLKTDGDFGKGTLAALQKYYGKSSVVDQKDFDNLFFLQAKKKIAKTKTETQTVVVNGKPEQIPTSAKDEFGAMLNVDAATFTGLAQLGKVINTMAEKNNLHDIELKKQEAKYGAFVQNGKANPKWKGPYGLYPSPTEARQFSEKWGSYIKTFKRIKANYDKRQAEYKNNPALKAAKAVAEAKDALMNKAKQAFASFKSWALSGTEEEGLGFVISGSVLLVTGLAVGAAALAAMYYLVKIYSRPTALDNEDITKVNADIDKSIASEKAEKAELYKKANERAAAGDTEGAKQFTEAALEKEKTISKLEESKTEIIKSQQENDKINAENAEKGGILNQIGDNAGKIAIAAGGLLVVGLIWQNKDSFKAKPKKEEAESEQEVLKKAA